MAFMNFGKRSKYGAEKVTVAGLDFDSKREANRWLVLKDAERRGVITDLRRQVKYVLIPNMFERVIKHLKTKDKEVEQLVFRGISYTADFVYEKDGQTVVEDCKISPKLVPKEYVIKEKLMYYFHKIKIKRVYKATDEV